MCQHSRVPSPCIFHPSSLSARVVILATTSITTATFTAAFARYMGSQVERGGTGREVLQFIFSCWDADSAHKVGWTTDKTCSRFGGEGTGSHCILKVWMWSPFHGCARTFCVECIGPPLMSMACEITRTAALDAAHPFWWSRACSSIMFTTVCLPSWSTLASCCDAMHRRFLL